MPGLGHLTPTEERLPVRLRNRGEVNDIFALCKQRMADDYLRQEPLLVFPHGLHGATTHFWSRLRNPDSVLPTIQPSIDDGRRGELDTLGKQIVTDYPHLARTGVYYQKLVDQLWDKDPPARFQFIDAGPTADHRYGEVRLGEEPLKPRPHKLKVAFRRCPNEG